jgi:hypothetical protein
MIVGTARLLVKSDHSAMTIPPAAQLEHGQFGLGCHVSSTAVEKDQRSV